MYTVRIFETAGNTDTEHFTAEDAFGAVYSDSLPLPEQATTKTAWPFAIYENGVCFHVSGDLANIGDPL